MAHEDTSFASLISPIDVETFFDEYFEARHLHVPRTDRAYYDDILTETAVDTYFRNLHIPVATVRVIEPGVELAREDFSQTNDAACADTQRLLSLLGEGKTLVINSACHSIPSLIHYRSKLEDELGLHLMCNIYITPGGAQGFAAHYDDHDVFVVQILGTKHWRLYDTPFLLPTVNQHREFAMDSLNEPSYQCDLDTGDLLYIPRGLVHEARATHMTSVHITIGLHPVYYCDLIHRAGDVARNDGRFRRSVPCRLADKQRERFSGEFADLFRSFTSSLDVADLERQASEAHSRSTPEPLQKFSVIARLADVGLDSRVSCTAPNVRETQDGNKLILRHQGRDVCLPWFMRESVRSALRREPFAVHEIRGMVDDAGRITLARLLIREGLLQVESYGAR